MSYKYLNIGNVCRAETATEAWEYWYNELEELHKRDFHDSSRDGDVVGEFINTVTVIADPTRNIVESDIRKLNKRYMIGEMLWYLSANNQLSAIQNYTSAWDRMSEDGEIVNSNYGSRASRSAKSRLASRNKRSAHLLTLQTDFKERIRYEENSNSNGSTLDNQPECMLARKADKGE